MINFFDLSELANIKAIGLALRPTPQSVWYMRCREYSQKFFTPLHIVVNELDPQFILDALYQEKFHPSIVDEELEDLLEILQQIRDPEYTSISSEDLESLVDNVLNKEIARKARTKNITPEEIASQIKAAEIKNPKSGGINFNDLEKQEARENTSGFKD